MWPSVHGRDSAGQIVVVVVVVVVWYSRPACFPTRNGASSMIGRKNNNARRREGTRLLLPRLRRIRERPKSGEHKSRRKLLHGRPGRKHADVHCRRSLDVQHQAENPPPWEDPRSGRKRPRMPLVVTNRAATTTAKVHDNNLCLGTQVTAQRKRGKGKGKRLG
jgi:hypothetical protein